MTKLTGILVRRLVLPCLSIVSMPVAAQESHETQSRAVTEVNLYLKCPDALTRQVVHGDKKSGFFSWYVGRTAADNCKPSKNLYIKTARELEDQLASHPITSIGAPTDLISTCIQSNRKVNGIAKDADRMAVVSDYYWAMNRLVLGSKANLEAVAAIDLLMGKEGDSALWGSGEKNKKGGSNFVHDPILTGTKEWSDGLRACKANNPPEFKPGVWPSFKMEQLGLELQMALGTIANLRAKSPRSDADQAAEENILDLNPILRGKYLKKLVGKKSVSDAELKETLMKQLFVTRSRLMDTNSQVRKAAWCLNGYHDLAGRDCLEESYETILGTPAFANYRNIDVSPDLPKAERDRNFDLRSSLQDADCRYQTRSAFKAGTDAWNDFKTDMAIMAVTFGASAAFSGAKAGFTAAKAAGTVAKTASTSAKVVTTGVAWLGLELGTASPQLISAVNSCWNDRAGLLDNVELPPVDPTRPACQTEVSEKLVLQSATKACAIKAIAAAAAILPVVPGGLRGLKGFKEADRIAKRVEVPAATKRLVKTQKVVLDTGAWIKNRVLVKMHPTRLLNRREAGKMLGDLDAKSLADLFPREHRRYLEGVVAQNPGDTAAKELLEELNKKLGPVAKNAPLAPGQSISSVGNLHGEEFAAFKKMWDDNLALTDRFLGINKMGNFGDWMRANEAKYFTPEKVQQYIRLQYSMADVRDRIWRDFYMEMSQRDPGFFEKHMAKYISNPLLATALRPFVKAGHGTFRFGKDTLVGWIKFFGVGGAIGAYLASPMGPIHAYFGRKGNHDLETLTKAVKSVTLKLEDVQAAAPSGAPKLDEFKHAMNKFNFEGMEPTEAMRVFKDMEKRFGTMHIEAGTALPGDVANGRGIEINTQMKQVNEFSNQLSTYNTEFELLELKMNLYTTQADVLKGKANPTDGDREKLARLEQQMRTYEEKMKQIQRDMINVLSTWTVYNFLFFEFTRPYASGDEIRNRTYNVLLANSNFKLYLHQLDQDLEHALVALGMPVQVRKMAETMNDDLQTILSENGRQQNAAPPAGASFLGGANTPARPAAPTTAPTPRAPREPASP